jgi:hypothetical protein
MKLTVKDPTATERLWGSWTTARQGSGVPEHQSATAIADVETAFHAILPNMAFTVWLVSAGDHHPEECEDSDIFEFLTGGVLAVHYERPGRWSDYYQPATWTRVAAAPNHKPGEPANQDIGPDFD